MLKLLQQLFKPLLLRAASSVCAACRLLLTTGLLLVTCFATAGENRLNLDDSKPVIDVWPAVSVLSDPHRAFDIQLISAAKDKFTAPQSAYAALGMRKDAVWLRIPVHVPVQGDGHWLLDIDYNVLNQIDVYVMRGMQVLQHARLGNMLSYSQRPMSSRTHTLSMKMPADADYDIFLRIDNDGTMILPITLNKASAFHEKAMNEQMLQGVLTGLGICLLIYSLAQWINLREHLFIKYALLISGSLMFSLLHFGIGAQYVWRDNLWIEQHVGGLSALIAACGSFLFIEQALAGPDTSKRFSRLMKLGATLLALCALAYSLGWINIQTVTAIVSTLGLAPALMGLPGALKRTRKGDSVGAYFLFAWLVYFLTTAIMIGVIKGTIPVNFWTMHSFQFGATVDMLVFMRVLGLRTIAIQTEAQRAAKERDTLHSLAYTDPLTGLPNRRGLNNTITGALPQCTPENILAIYMLDLDGFKQVNDQYGHDVGDELLIAVAMRLQANLRTSDIVARLGGDEFVVMSKNLHTDQQAHDLGTKLLDAFNKPFTLSENTCSVGLTIGYALAPLDAHDTVSLLKQADGAMYAGKQAGKHCLRRGYAQPELV